MRAFRVAEVGGRKKPSRIMVADNIFAAVRRFTRCHVIHTGGALFDSTREAPAEFECVRGDTNAGRQFIAYAIGKEF